MGKGKKLAVVGLGYVGLPLAVHFGTKYETIGFDLKQSIVDNSLAHKDPTGEVSKEEFKKAKLFTPTTDPKRMSGVDIIIVAV
ncbi:MAG: nucleotide sugar dehydrogenase, partial [Desulfobacterales bacterium]|nr:nucleotide sugar dehydrogenase [Desulfobacterales bacterium]